MSFIYIYILRLISNLPDILYFLVSISLRDIKRKVIKGMIVRLNSKTQEGGTNERDRQKEREKERRAIEEGSYCT